MSVGKFLEIFGKKKELFRKYSGLEEFLNRSETFVFIFLQTVQETDIRYGFGWPLHVVITCQYILKHFKHFIYYILQYLIILETL